MKSELPVDFRDAMQEDSRMKCLNGQPHRWFKSIKIGQFELSVQASSTHYCMPKRVLEPREYESFELAIFEHGKWVNPHEDPKLQGYRWVHYFEEPFGETSVAGYVPVANVQEIYEVLQSLIA